MQKMASSSGFLPRNVFSVLELAILVPLLSALTGFCPLYVLLHIDTTYTDRPHC